MSIRDFTRQETSAGGEVPASSPLPSTRPRYVVGIGASAGGLDALERFFDHLPHEDGGIAYVVVQHLSPDFRSVMDELLARHTDLPIRLVEDGMPVEAGHIYLIPPKKDMIISGGRLLLSDRDRQQELSLPIDVFFRSLAQDCGPRAVAIVLSGGGSDGSRGIRDVHEAGGLVIVQDDQTAQFDGMPRTARDAGVASFVLPPEEMPRALFEHAKQEPGNGANGNVARPSGGIDAIYRMLQESFGIDFTHYKPSTVTRRIERRIALARTEDIGEYVERLRKQGEELDVLYRDLLIGVTRFFRNREAFAILEERVLPDLLKRAPRDRPFRAWVAGCATGEEAYSLAISISELMGENGGERPVKIFATDVHRGSLERASSGIFDEEAVAGVAPERLERYFVRHGRTYQAVPELRSMIVFAHHNVIRDAPFTHVDLISCRNLLIYLQPPAQQKALSLFHFALDRGGVLFLGPSESPGPMARDFENVDKHWRMYRKHSDARTSVEKRLLPMRLPEPRIDGAGPPLARYSLAHILGTYDTLLAEHMPPSLLVNDRSELVHVFGGASKMLTPRDGRQGLSVLDVVGPELKMVLVGGLKRAMIEPQPIVYRGVRLRVDGEEKAFSVGIRRVNARGVGAAPHLLVSFDAHEAPPVRPTEREIDVAEISRAQVGALEAELSSTKENLQAAIEELETSNEELQAANEELLASNEELQSTNEELQSVNEELYTVNAEYQRKIAELTVLTNDMDNLLSSTDVGAIFLDSQLRIRKFTPQVAQSFNLVAHDVGRPIETFAHNLDQPRLMEDLRQVLSSGQRIERELRDLRGNPYFLRLLPYRAKGAVDGVVLTLIDMTGLKAAEDALFHERYLLDSLLGTVPDAIYFKDAGGRVIRMNRAMADRFGIGDPRSAAGKTVFELTTRESAIELFAPDEDVVRTGQPQHYRLERRVRSDGQEAWDLVSRLPLRDRDGRIVGLIGIFRDVTEAKRAEEKIQEGVKRRDQFLAMLSHELRNPLNAIVTSTELLKAHPSEDKTERMLAILERQSHQMSRLLDDLLEASRVTQNKIELKRRVVDLGGILRDAADAVRSLFDARGHAFALDVTGEMPIDGDPARLQQIHVNLLSNAAKYTPPGGTVSVRALRDGAWAVVRVRDTGVGIPREMIDSVFDLFVQSHRTLDRADGGLGLGLTIVRSLVQMHGGTVAAESDGEGKGTEFIVRLPIATHADPEVAPSRISRAPLGRRVLLVEDNRDGRAMLTELLELDGFTCASAESGAAALDIIAKACPDIALVDLGLPGMSGLELARRLRADPRYAHLFLVALTGYGQAADREAARAAGFDEHVVKPVSRARLAELLGQAD